MKARVLLFFSIFFLFLLISKNAYATCPSGVDGWSYCKQHNITNATGADVNYTINITVNNSTGTDSASIVYINNKARSDFGDIRFTNSTGSLLSYYMETLNTGINATFWVRITENLTSTNQTIYVFYGNSSATNLSNGTNTFTVFFVDFNTYNTGNLDGQDGWFQQTGGGTANVWQVQTGTVYEGAKAAGSSNATYDENVLKTFNANVSDMRIVQYMRKNNSNTAYQQIMVNSWSSGARGTIFGLIAFNSSGYLNYFNQSARAIGTYSANTWYRVEGQFRSSDYKGRWNMNNGAFTDWTGQWLSWSGKTFGEYEMDYDHRYPSQYQDLIFVTKFTPSGTEPAHGTWGNEETVDSTPPTITVQSPVNNTVYPNNTIWFNVTLNEAGSKCLVNISNTNQTLTNSTGNWNYLNNTLADGNYWTRLFCNDTAGNMNSSVYVNFTIDTTAPIVTIQSPTNTTYNTTIVWANATLNEAGSWCGRSLDGATNVTMSNSTGNWNNQMNSLSQGSHNVRFYCNDTAGNMNGSASNIVYFTVNSSYLEVNLTYPPINSNAYQNNNFTLNATATCRNVDCGTVQGTVQYNGSSSNPDTVISITDGATPFYILFGSKEYLSNYSFFNNSLSTAGVISADNYTLWLNTSQRKEYNSTDEINSSGNQSVNFSLEIPSDVSQIKLSFALASTLYNSITWDWVTYNISIYNHTDSKWVSKYNTTVTFTNYYQCIVSNFILNITNDFINGNTVNISLDMKEHDKNPSFGGASVSSYTCDGETFQPTSTWGESFVWSRIYLKYGSTRSCGSLSQDQSCQLNWTVNATGNIDSAYKFDVLFSTPVTQNYTDNATIRILESAPPTYSLNSTNSTIKGKATRFSLYWNDSTALHPNGQWQAWLDNCTGSFVNVSPITNFTSTPQWTNFTATINSTLGCTVRWFVNATDNVENINNTGSTNPFSFVSEAETLIEYLTAISNNLNWTYNTQTVYWGNVFEEKNKTHLEQQISNYVAVEDWQNVLFWSEVGKKIGLENQTAIQSALNGSEMVNGLPKSGNDANGNYFYVYDGERLYGFYWSNEYSYNLTKWNITDAYNNFHDAWNNTGHGFLQYYNSSYTNAGLSRFYDELAQTIRAFLIFYELANNTGALNDANSEWMYINNNVWNSTSNYYPYQAGLTTYECEAGFFYKIVSLLKYHQTDLGNWSRITTDMDNRFLANRWNSPQWMTSSSGTETYVVVHANPITSQRRLYNTLGAWFPMFGYYDLMNDTQKSNLRDLLTGYSSYYPAWRLLLSSNASLYSGSELKFKANSNDFSTAYDATSAGVTLMFLLGIIPNTTTIAFPLEELHYEYIYDMDPDLFRINITDSKIRLPILKQGYLDFKYNTTNVTYDFPSHGVYEIDFAGDWNSVTSVTKLSELPSDRKYLVEYYPPTYSNNQTNTTTAGQPSNFTLDWQDNIGLLSGYIFSTNNSGTWVNSSFVSFSGQSNTSWNVTALNSTPNTVVGWCFYANDTSNNWNGTSCANPFTFTTGIFYQSASQSFSIISSLPVKSSSLKSVTGFFAADSGLSRLLESFKMTSASMLFNNIISRISQLLRLPTSYFNIAQSTSRLATLYTSLTSYFTISQSASRLVTLYKSLSQSVTANAITGRLLSSFKSLSDSFFISQSITRTLSSMRSITSSFAFNATSIRISNIYKSITSSFVINQSVSRLPTLLRTITSYFTADQSLSRLSSMYKSITSYFTISQTYSRLSTLYRSIASSSMFTDALSRTSLIFKLLPQSMSVTQLSSRSSTLFKSATTSLAISQAYSRLTSLFITASSPVSLSQSLDRIGTMYRTLTSYFIINNSYSRLSFIYRSITSSLDISQYVSRLSSAYKYVTGYFTFTSSLTRISTLYQSLSSSFTSSTLVSRISSLYKSLTGYFVVNQYISRLPSLYRSLTSSLTINESLSRLSTSLRYLSDSITMNALSSRVSTLLRSITGYVALGQTLSESSSLTKMLSNSFGVSSYVSRELYSLRDATGSFLLDTLSSRMSSAYRSLYQSSLVTQIINRVPTSMRYATSFFTTDMVLTRANSFFRMVMSSYSTNTSAELWNVYSQFVSMSLTFSESTSRLLNLLKIIPQPLSANLIAERLLTLYRMSPDSFGVGSIIYRGLNFQQIFTDSFLFNFSARLLNAYYKSPTGSFILSSSTSRISEMSRLFGDAISVNLIGTRFMLLGRDLTSSLSVSSSLYRLMTITRVVSTGFSLAGTMSRLQFITSVFSQQFSSIANAFGVRSRNMNEIITTLSLTFSNSVQRTVMLTRTFPETLSVNAMLSRTLSLVRMLSSFFGFGGITYGLRPLVCSLQLSESNCAFIGGCYWCSGTCKASTCTQPSLPGGGGGGWSPPTTNATPEVKAVLDTAVDIQNPEVNAGDKIYAKISLMKIEGPKGVVNVNITYWIKDIFGNVIGTKQTVVGVETMRSDIYFFTLPTDSLPGTYTFEVLAQYNHASDYSSANFVITERPIKQSIIIKRVDVPFILVGENTTIKIILENQENRKVDFNITLILPYTFDPINATKNVSMGPLEEDIIDFAFVPHESGSFSGFVKVELEDKKYFSDFAIEVYATERFINYMIKNYWWLIDLFLALLVVIFLYLTRKRFKKKEKIEYVYSSRNYIEG